MDGRSPTLLRILVARFDIVLKPKSGLHPMCACVVFHMELSKRDAWPKNQLCTPLSEAWCLPLMQFVPAYMSCGVT